MRSLLLHLAPPRWRDRYGIEIDDLLAHSTHPLRDRFDLARAALILRTDPSWQERPMSPRSLLVTAAVLAALGLGLVAAAVGRLHNGLSELPQHWWSTLAAAPLLLAVLTLAAALVLGRGSDGAQRSSS